MDPYPIAPVDNGQEPPREDEEWQYEVDVVEVGTEADKYEDC